MATTAWAPPTEKLERVRAFMNERVVPNEAALDREDDESAALIATLQQEVKDAGLLRVRCEASTPPVDVSAQKLSATLVDELTIG